MAKTKNVTVKQQPKEPSRKSLLTTQPIEILSPLDGAEVLQTFTAEGETDPSLGTVEVAGLVTDLDTNEVYVGVPPTQNSDGSARWFITFSGLPANSSNLWLTAYITSTNEYHTINIRTPAHLTAEAPLKDGKMGASARAEPTITIGDATPIFGNAIAATGTTSAEELQFILARWKKDVPRKSFRHVVGASDSDRNWTTSIPVPGRGRYLVAAVLKKHRAKAKRVVDVP